MNTHPDFPAETAYLQDVLSFLSAYNAEISTQKDEIDKLVAYSLAHYNSDNSEQFVELINNTSTQEALVKKTAETKYAINKPYFARVDFTPDDTENDPARRLYIGKMTLMRGLEILITDWRAPVSSLYYEGRIGRAGYECPDGFIEGEISLKRQYEILNGEIKAFTDIDITANDEFLQAALGASKDRRLKDIVTTIQAEQNRVIRAPVFTPIIVQGAAGGGKTTIALHRIAYMLYNYADKIRARQIMIIAPTGFFLSYISDVLPDLGVELVRQTTFEDFAAECLEAVGKLSVNPSADVLAYAADNGKYKTKAMAAAHLKGLLKYKTLVEKYCAYLEQNLAPREDFVLEGYELFTHEALSDLFLRDYSYLPVGKRANEIHKHLTNTLRKEKPLGLRYIEADYDRQREFIKRDLQDCDKRRALIAAILDERDEKLKRIKNQSKVIIRRYMRVFDMKKSTDYYRDLFTTPDLFETLAQNIFPPEQAAIIKSQTLSVIGKNKFDADDLPALMLIQMKLFGLEDGPDIKHVVIDEAQDFSLFQLAVLKDVTVNATFSVLGDLHQGIYSYKGVRNWQDAGRRVFGEAGFSYMTLEQSYRTTIEVMDAANKVISRSGTDIAPLAKPVIRHGSPVEVIVTSGRAACALEIDRKITEYLRDGSRSIAIIGKTAEECRAFKKLLKTNPVLITGKEDEYPGGLLILPCYLAKGLEFDAVIIANASKENYREEELLDIRLLYISMTRALHSLTVFAVGDTTGLLEQ